MNKLLYMIIVILLLTNCTGLPGMHYKLLEGLTEPTPLEEVNITIHDMNFFTAGWECLEEAGPLKYIIHPLIVPVLGCTSVTWNDDRVISCEIWYNGWEWVLDHELEHCKGWSD